MVMSELELLRGRTTFGVVHYTKYAIHHVKPRQLLTGHQKKKKKCLFCQRFDAILKCHFQFCDSHLELLLVILESKVNVITFWWLSESLTRSVKKNHEINKSKYLIHTYWLFLLSFISISFYTKVHHRLRIFSFPINAAIILNSVFHRPSLTPSIAWI